MHQLAIETLEELGMTPSSIRDFLDRDRGPPKTQWDQDTLILHFAELVHTRCKPFFSMSRTVYHSARFLYLVKQTAGYLWKCLQNLGLDHRKGWHVQNALARMIVHCKPLRDMALMSFKHESFNHLWPDAYSDNSWTGRPFIIQMAVCSDKPLSQLAAEFCDYTFASVMTHPEFGWSCLEFFSLKDVKPDFGFLATPEQMLEPRPGWHSSQFALIPHHPLLAQFGLIPSEIRDPLLIDAIFQRNDLARVSQTFQKSIESLRSYVKHVDDHLGECAKQQLLLPPICDLVRHYLCHARITDAFLEECEARNRLGLSFAHCPSGITSVPKDRAF